MKYLLIIFAVVISATTVGQTADHYLKSGIEKYNSKDFEGAIKDYTQAIKVNGNLRDGYFNRGICEWALQDFDSAQKDFDKTIQLDPKFAKAYYDRAIILISQQEYIQSLPDLDKTIELDETSSSALMLRGEIRARTGNNTGACEDFNKAKEMGEPQAEENIIKYCRTPKDEQVYDSMATEICSCTHANQKQKVSLLLDSCYKLILKNNYTKLQKLGIDSTTLAGKDKLYDEIFKSRLRLNCKETVEKLVKEYEEDNANNLTFTGRFISQAFNDKKKYYVLILQSKQTKEKKEFHCAFSINEDAQNSDIKVEYEVVKNKETKQEELVVKSISSMSE